MVFFFNDTATSEICSLSLHDVLPIWLGGRTGRRPRHCVCARDLRRRALGGDDDRAQGGDLFALGAGTGQLSLYSLVKSLADRKSTRLNSSHSHISYADFCLKK